MVKPKMHGPEEAAFTNDLLDRVERELGLPPTPIKLGIMAEERRTTANPAECIRAAPPRCLLLHTRLPARTGDEIHTSFHLGPVLPKAEIKAAVSGWREGRCGWCAPAAAAAAAAAAGFVSVIGVGSRRPDHPCPVASGWVLLDHAHARTAVGVARRV